MQATKQSGFVASLAVVFAMSIGSAFAQTWGGASKVFELRIYTANAGKLADFQTAFRSQALLQFAKYGIENVFDGTVLEGARADGGDAGNMLVCILAHQNRAAADKAWARLEGDATWQSASKLLAKPAVSIFMSPTDFSPALEPPSSGSTTRVFELRKYNTGADALPRMVDEFKSGLAAILSKNGMTAVPHSRGLFAAQVTSSFALSSDRERDDPAAGSKPGRYPAAHGCRGTADAD